MNKIKFEIGGRTVNRQTPENWNELDLEQALYAVPRVMFKNKSRRLLDELVFFFLQMKEKDLQHINRSQMDGLHPAVDWMFKSITLTNNLLPSITMGEKIYQGPRDGLEDISVSQFAFADKFMNAFLKSKEEKYLDMLITTLYQPTGEKFDNDKIEAWAQDIAKGQLEYRLVIFAFYLGSRNAIAERYPEVFKKQNKVKHNKSGWLGFFYELAGPKIGSYSNVAATNFLEILGIMRKIKDDAEEAQRHARKLKHR